jgi:hypothetical protein
MWQNPAKATFDAKNLCESDISPKAAQTAKTEATRRQCHQIEQKPTAN